MIRMLAPLFMTLPLFSGLPTSQEALSLAFPGAQFSRREFYLSEAQGKAVREASGVELPGLWLVAYEARKDGKLLGVGFFDTHQVRTLQETAMVAVSGEGKVLRVEVVVFREPAEYLAREAWLRQFQGRRLDEELSLKRGIRPLAGATLTAHALTDAARRSLALHRVLYGAAQ